MQDCGGVCVNDYFNKILRKRGAVRGAIILYEIVENNVSRSLIPPASIECLHQDLLDFGIDWIFCED